MRIAHVITHPEVIVDPATPTPLWGLSAVGARRMRQFAASPEMRALDAVWSSEETKAVEAADLLAAPQGLVVRRRPDLGENDRSATGYLPPSDFEAMADAFFSRPAESVRGWERAVDAQARMVGSVEAILRDFSGDRLAIVAHGAVGTLLLCHLLGEPISRAADQPFQGCHWTFDIDSRRVLHRWRSIAPR